MILPKWLLLSAIALQVAWCWNGFSDGGSDLDVLMRRRLDLLSSERRTRQAPQAHSRETDTSQYDLTLHRVKVNLNRTAADHQMLFTRVRSSGNLYLYSGNQISRVTVAETEVKLVPVAATSDIHEEVSEFQIEELKAIDNKTTLIVTVSLPDRMHVYQISGNSKGKVLTVKAMQRIKRPGQTHQSVLVQSKSNLFLISGYSEARFGKVVIYRWLDFHFSLRDVKEVDRCDKLLVFSGDQLVILVLEMAEYPERSVNNIFMLNDEFKLVKTQEMYFLFDRLPHYEVENQFYILRCLALDTCFLYRWNGESLFRRASKISYDPRNIDIMASGHGMIAMSLERTLYFYDNQPLLKIAASYAIVNRRGTVTDKPFQLDPRVSDMFLYKEEATEKLYLCILYNSGAKLLDMVEIQLNKGRSAPSPGEQSNFNALKTCLFHMKDLANIRKKWIDLIKYQLSKTLRSCKSTGVLSLASKVFLAESNKVDRIEVDGNIENSPQDLLKEWSSTKKSLAEMHSQSQNLFYLNRMNTVQSNMKIQGNLRTKSTRMKHVKVHHPHSGRPAYVRPKRDLQSSRVITSAIINAREVVYNGKMFAYTLSRNNVNYVSSPVHVANLHTQNVHIGLNTINRIPVDQMLYNATDKFVEKGHKVFKAIDTNTLKVYLVNGEKTTQQFSSLRNFVVTAGSEAPVKLSGARGVTNLIVGGKLNNVSLDDLLHQLYYVDKKSTINGNVFLRAPSYIRNVYARSLNSFPTSNIFDLRTNQTISAVVHLSQVYARNVYSKTINGINIPKDVALISSAKTIKAAVASNFVVKKDLTLSAEDQHFTKHVLGTKVEDFSQIYSGRVYLKGSLKLKQLNLENQKSQLVLNGFTASPDVQNHFWMKRVEQFELSATRLLQKPISSNPNKLKKFLWICCGSSSNMSKEASKPATNVTVCVGCAAGCNQSDSVEDMVQCDTCESWWHYTCANVDETVKDRSWSCVKCPPRRSVLRSGKSSKSRASATSSSSVRRAQLQLELERIEKEKQLVDRLHQEREEEEEKARAEEAARREKRFAEKKAREEELLQKRFALLQTMVALDDDRSEDRSEGSRSSVRSSKSKVENWMDRHMQGKGSGLGKTVGQSEVPPGNATYSNNQTAKTERMNTVPNTRSLNVNVSRQEASGEVRNRSVKQQMSGNLAMIPYPMRSHLDFARGLTDYYDKSSDVGEAEATARPNVEGQFDSREGHSMNRPIVDPRAAITPLGNNPLNSTPLSRTLTTGPSAQQLAARHVVPKDLPIFSGDPADWPIFISAYNNSTDLCGFSDGENLMRLQRCLKGDALDAVRSYLLLPSAVPFVISTLTTLYGRPELIVNNLLSKVRALPPPKADKLETLVSYGLSVQNLCAHLRASGLDHHLNNPSVLQELVEKLPASIKLDWALYKRYLPEVDLGRFGDYMASMVAAASDVIVPVAHEPSKVDRPKYKSFVNAHVEDEHPENSSIKYAQNVSSTNLKIEMDGMRCLMCEKPGHKVKDCGEWKRRSLAERWDIAERHNLCKRCLIPHGRWPCKVKQDCGVGECRDRHHSLLHPGKPDAPGPSSFIASGMVGTHGHEQGGVLFKIVPVVLHGERTSIQTFAFLDSGSSLTMVDEELAEQIGVRGETKRLYLKWTSNVSREESKSQRVTMEVSGIDEMNRYKISNVCTVARLELPAQTLDYAQMVAKFPYLEGLPVQSYVNAVPRILIGLEHTHLKVTLWKREGRVGEPVAAKTRLGWAVFGRYGGGIDVQTCLHIREEKSKQDLHEFVQAFFEVESLGVDVKNTLVSEDNQRAVQILRETTVRTQAGNYETGLLWKTDVVEFPDSYGMAVRRLKSLERRLRTIPELRSNVEHQIQHYLEQGYAHKVSEEELRALDPKRSWFLPLGVVLNPKKPGKVRLIWDAAAEVKGVSFNSVLLKGPDLLTSLPAVLCRFRQRQTAVTGDIKEMFHLIQIRRADRSAQLFLFRGTGEHIGVYMMDVATFGSTCSPCAAQYVKNLNAKEFEKEFPEAAAAIIENHYVDDYLDSRDTEDEVAKIALEVKKIHAKAGFEIRNWMSNSKTVLERVGERSSEDVKSFSMDKSGIAERVLGLVWLPWMDVFTFNMEFRDDLKPLIFDGEEWNKRIGLIAGLQKIMIPRCYFTGYSPESLDTLELHVFVDGSENAYCCVAYFRIIDRGQPRCALVASKTKVAPLKFLSIPRMELQAALIGVRLAKSIEENHTLRVTRRYFWTDSCTVLAWLRSDSRRYRQFVAYRVGEILAKSQVSEWNYVQSGLNVADDGTKWKIGISFNPNNRWYAGPEFLHKAQICWPKKDGTLVPTNEELRQPVLHHIEASSPWIQVDRFSRWERLHRSTSYVYRFMNRRKSSNIEDVMLTKEELQQAERSLWRLAQSEMYSEELRILESNKRSEKGCKKVIDRCSPLAKLSPFVDDYGVIRMETRSLNATYAPCSVVILPRHHRVTYLIADWYHREYRHANKETVVNEMRQVFHVSRLRTLVRQVSERCQRCIIRKTKPQIPRMGPLPEVRLTPYVRPFTYTGVDYCGPFLVKVGRSLVKRWIALFTCMTVRAIHLEIAYSLSADSFKMVIRRFIARRGAPLEIFSDNGTNFRGASNELKEEIKMINQNLAATFTNTTTKWRFNPPLAPHMGGCWERLVRSVKTALAGLEMVRNPDDETLWTLMVEAEAMVNSRPLTYVPLDTVDQEALTPNHFMMLSSSGVCQPPKELVDDRTQMRSNWRWIQHLLSQFWTRWIKEYLPTITRRTKWFNEVKPVKDGDVVIVVEEGTRNGWIRGRIVRTLPGKDGRVRQADVQTSNGILRRPVAKIAVLEDIGTFTFNRNVKASHLVCAELNYNPTVSYLRGDHWPSHLNLEMSNAYVRGFIKTYATTPTFLQHISTEAVLRGSMSTVSGRKVFTGQLHTDTLVADGVDAINVQSLATDFSTMAFLDGVKEIEHFSSEECYIELLGGLTLQEYQNVSFNAIVESTVNTHNPQTLEYLFLPDIKVEHFRAALINGVNAEDFITEIDNFTYRVDPFAAQFKIDNLIVKKNVISTSQMFMDYLNTIAVKEYFKLLTLKGDSDKAQQWEIGGSKTLQKGMAVDGKLKVVHVNRLILDNILYNSARKTGPMNIAGLWNITKLATKYLATKQINDLPIKHLQNSNLKSFKIKHDISVGILTISANMHGHLFPNSSSVSMPPNIQMLASLTVHGSFLLEHWKPGTLLFDVMLSAVTGSTNVFDKKLVFRGHHVEIEKLRNEGKIFSKSCNFVNLLMDSVKRRQPNLVFSSLGKTFREVVCLGSVASNDLVTATLVNGIDVIHLNRSIHSVGHHQEMIKSTKYFEEEVKVVQLLCHDQLVDGIYPSNLDLYSDASQMVKKRYQFEKPISVIGNLYVDAINDFSLQHFLATRVVKNRTYTQDYHQEKSQQVTGFITFSNLVLSGEYNTVHVVNGIPVSEIVSRSSNEHQVMVETKHLTGTIQLIGPTSVMKCNNVSLLDAYKSSFKANSAEIAFKDLIFNSNGVLQNGLTIENKLNGVSVQKMMKLRLSSVEELLPLIPIIREQISVSNRAYLTNKPKDLHMLYIENIPLDERGTMVGKSEGQRTNEASDTVNFEKSCSNGIYRFNVTIRQKSSNGDISSARTVLDGVMIKSDWMEISNNGEIQTIVVSQVEKNAKYFLLLYVNRNGKLSVQQELPLSSSAAVFYFVHVNDSALLLAVSDSHPLQLGHLAPKLKLFRYDPDVMRFVHFKTLSGHYNDVVAIDVEDVIMFAVSEQGSNMVEIFVLDRSYSALFQKLIFDSTLASMKAFKLQGSPVLQISTVDNLVYVYNYSILEGWRQLSYGRIPSDVN